MYVSHFLGKRCVIKERFEKKYRVPELDKKLTRSRIINESRNIARAYKFGINTPSLLYVDLNGRKIYMEYLESAVQLKELLKVLYSEEKLSNYENLIQKLINNLGEAIAKMHNCDIIHGDLTTSNMLVKISHNNNNIIKKIMSDSDYEAFYLIDFGLSYVSNKDEDKAVDLYVLKRAIISANPKSVEVFDRMMVVYSQVANKGEVIVEQMKKVEMRGRKKVAFG